MSNRALPIAVVLMLTFVWGCKQAQTAPPNPAPTPVTQAQPAAEETGAMSDRNLKFAFDLFGKLQAEKPGENLFVSPISVSMALGMTANGAAGSTRDAMFEALHWQGLTIADVDKGLQALKVDLQSADPALKLTIADSLWSDDEVEFKPGFLEANRTFFDAEVASLDFADPASAKRINDWVNDKTNGLIPEITTPQDLAGLWMMLLDAVYFKGKWTDPFEKDKTEDATFTLLEGEKTVPMMAQVGEYRYLEDHKLQAIALPYGNQRVEMIVVLPAPDNNLADFCQGLNADDFNDLLRNMAKREGTIKLPRFTAKMDRKLNDVLGALGMAEAFDKDKADFSDMSESKVWIDIVRQKSFVKVDEEGTEAAAVTQVGMVGAAAPAPGEPFEMIVNRPFFLAIRDAGTETLLFMGAIVEPEEE